MYKEPLSNKKNHIGTVIASPIQLLDRIRKKGNNVLWGYLEHRYPQIFKTSECSSKSTQLTYQESFLAYKDQYVVLRHYKNIGKSKGSILCVPPLGYSAGYFDCCFGQILDLSLYGFDVFVINYPVRPSNFEEIADDFFQMVLDFLDSKGFGPIRIWCSVGIGSLFVQRNAALGHHIDVAILINAPQQPTSLYLLPFSKKLRYPETFRHAYLLFDDLEKFDHAMVRGEKAWIGMDDRLQMQWKEWVKNQQFGYCIPSDSSGKSKISTRYKRKDLDDVMYFIHPCPQNIENTIYFYTDGHVWQPNPHIETDIETRIEKQYQSNFNRSQVIVLQTYQLPQNFMDFFFDVLK